MELWMTDLAVTDELFFERTGMEAEPGRGDRCRDIGGNG